jgi:hypothetical protein
VEIIEQFHNIFFNEAPTMLIEFYRPTIMYRAFFTSSSQKGLIRSSVHKSTSNSKAFPYPGPNRLL